MTTHFITSILSFDIIIFQIIITWSVTWEGVTKVKTVTTKWQPSILATAFSEMKYLPGSSYPTNRRINRFSGRRSLFLLLGMLSFAVTKASLLGIIRKQKNISCYNDHHSNRHNVFHQAYYLYQPTVQLHSPLPPLNHLVLHHSKPRNQSVKYHPISSRNCSMFGVDQSKKSTMFQQQAIYLVVVLPLLMYESMRGNQNIVCQMF